MFYCWFILFLHSRCINKRSWRRRRRHHPYTYNTAGLRLQSKSQHTPKLVNERIAFYVLSPRTHMARAQCLWAHTLAHIFPCCTLPGCCWWFLSCICCGAVLFLPSWPSCLTAWYIHLMFSYYLRVLLLCETSKWFCFSFVFVYYFISFIIIKKSYGEEQYARDIEAKGEREVELGRGGGGGREEVIMFMRENTRDITIKLCVILVWCGCW